ncbi:HAD-IA family hydrolase [Mycolicibacterium septicum DSM 44393]|uniref:HAD-IA family hydrolase n=1 Tax=Mycolicibacterium septicum DSM 44393 TaxID=1341646 RepID=A0A7X6MMB2_9MYCO|nr:HAD-IA family hydrolase [Mycolicibacterium septicum]NKZ10789.1 HAD-IA family hydrolase [Mycolicibacterium septicum DSM 44393]
MRALIFDCDGVLADTEKDGHRVAFNQAFRDLGIPVQWSVNDYGPLLAVGGGKERLRAFLTPDRLAQLGISSDQSQLGVLVHNLHQRKSSAYQDLIRSGAIAARPGVARLAHEALSTGWAVAIASTSAVGSVQAVSRHVFGRGLAEQIPILAGDVVARKKPAPDIYLIAAAKLAVQPSDCIAIEDSPVGCAAAVSAAMTCVITESEYTAGANFSNAALVIRDLGEPGDPEPPKVIQNPHGLTLRGPVSLSDLRWLADARLLDTRQ